MALQIMLMMGIYSHYSSTIPLYSGLVLFLDTPILSHIFVCFCIGNKFVIHGSAKKTFIMLS